MFKNRPNITIYTDGACKGNPGGLGGWGVVITDFETIQEYFGGEVDTTNNRMEMMAVVEALSKITTPSNIQLHTDSKYVINGISQWINGWKRNGWKTAAGTPVKNVDLWKQIDKARLDHVIDWKWIKGHNGDPGNERADKLANKGVDLVRGMTT